MCAVCTVTYYTQCEPEQSAVRLNYNIIYTYIILIMTGVKLVQRKPINILTAASRDVCMWHHHRYYILDITYILYIYIYT